MEYKEIPGLTYYVNVITQPLADKILTFINSQPWQKSLKRDVQQYGTKYNYTSRSLGETVPIPKILLELAKSLGLPEPDNIIINKYEPGEGIAPHVDSNIFGDTIASLSLMSKVPMDLQSGNDYHIIWLEPNSMIKLTGQSRYHWTHGICARKSDIYNNKKIIRYTRISITFRTLAGKTQSNQNTITPDLKSDLKSDWVEV